jgi:hypothetical protein
MPSRSAERERGSVTAELATVMPAVVLIMGCCLGAVQLVGQQVRLTDAAADAARALARGDSADHVSALAGRSVAGATYRVERRGEFVCARLGAPAGGGPIALFGLRAEAFSCALAGGL